MWGRGVFLCLIAAMLATAGADALAAPPVSLQVRPMASQPVVGTAADSSTRITKLRAAIVKEPKLRRPRFELVQALVVAGRLDEALKEAAAWRARDAYNLLVVRMLGDLQARLGDRVSAMRTWSAVVELLPQDASAHRALASALKQAGELKAACARLQRAVDLHGHDHRLRFELADCLHRQGDLAVSETLFSTIVHDKQAPKLVSGPARQRLAQVWGEQRRQASVAGDKQRCRQLDSKRAALRLEGGVNSDIKVFLSWDTDRSDIDLWVTNPAGQRVWYRSKKGRQGGTLFGDVTTGYGPEMYSAPRAHRGVYKVQVNYFATARRGLREARGEVVILLGEGSANSRRVVLPYRLFKPGQTVTVAEIHSR